MQPDWYRVHNAATLEEAELIVTWLSERDITARVKDRHMVGTLTWGTPAIAPVGVEVVVNDEPTAQRAIQLLADHHESNPPPRNTSPVEAVCEECGRSATYPPETRGRVEECPHCGRYVDVPE